MIRDPRDIYYLPEAERVAIIESLKEELGGDFQANLDEHPMIQALTRIHLAALEDAFYAFMDKTLSETK